MDSNIGKPAADYNWRNFALVIVAIYILAYLVPLGIRPGMIPDELRYAEIPREMITTGDWVSPHLNGLRYFEKPVMGYWLTAISEQVFGENRFAFRLPSALAAGLASLGICLLLFRLGYPRRTALAAALIHLSMLGVFVIGTLNILDTVFSFFLTAAFISFALSHREPAGRRLNFYLVLTGVFCGAAFLTKGFLAFALLGAVILPYLVMQGRWMDLFSRGWLAFVTTLLVIAPWAIMVHLREPDYWHYFFWEEHVRRFAADDAQHTEPLWYYVTYLPLLALPWITQLPAAVKGLITEKDKTTITSFALYWLLVPFLIFSIARGKLPTYILPCMAPLSILLAIGLERYLQKPDIRLFKSFNLLLAAVFVVAALVIILFQTGVTGYPLWPDHDHWKLYVLVTAMLATVLLLVFANRVSNVQSRIVLPSLGMLVFCIGLNIALPEPTVESKMPGRFLLQHADLVTPDTVLFSDDIMIHAVNWYYKRTDVYMTGAGESEHGLSFDDSRYKLVEMGPALQARLLEVTQTHPAVVIHHSDADDYMKTLMPAQAKEYRWGKFVLWHIPVTALAMENTLSVDTDGKEARY